MGDLTRRARWAHRAARFWRWVQIGVPTLFLLLVAYAVGHGMGRW